MPPQRPITYPVRVDLLLVEEAVLAHVRDLPPETQRVFHSEREPVYEVPDPDDKESRFRALHGTWFEKLEMAAPVRRALLERPSILSGTEQCRIFLAKSRKEEHADLLVPSGGPCGASLVLRIRAETFRRPDALLTFLRRELLHVVDMLDPDFGYERRLPDAEQGPLFQNLLLDRYRTLWETTIEGRLHREGRLGNEGREARRGEFHRTFRMLGNCVDAVFLRWFDCRRPRHREMVAFARAPPAAADGEAWSGTCPICRMPSAEAHPHSAQLPASVLQAIQTAYPAWCVAHGICRQCADLFEAGLRSDSLSADGSLDAGEGHALDLSRRA